ncbi:dormancy-associated protein homolog 3-like [Punica granatum]|nr:dormancy-associated protein homolog 3-like [Punica granatum]
MGLLDHLWDDTVAGPPPETGLGKLRKLKSFGSGANSGKESNPNEAVKISRSITIVKPPGYQPGSTPASPAGSTPPVSPFSGGSGSLTRFRRRSTSDAYEKTREIIPRSPFDI